MIKKIDKIVKSVAMVVSWISYIGIFFIMFLIVIDALLRKFAASGVTGSYELVERSLLCIVFAAFAYTQSHEGHIQITMFISKFPRVMRFIVFGIADLIAALGAAATTYAAFLQVQVSMQAGTQTSVLQIPLYPFYIVEAVCMVVFTLVLLWSTVKAFIAVKNDELCEEFQSQWS